MVRTVIALDREDKDWLDRHARQQGVSMTELVRRAVRQLREAVEHDGPPLEELLRRTSGTWKAGDGLDYQRRIRDEW